MKYSVRDYAKAFDAALANPKVNKGDAAKHFVALVKKNHDEARLKKILDETARLVRKRGGPREVVIVSARPLTKQQEKSIAALVPAGDTVTYEIDPTLVAGVKIIVNGEAQFDGSMKAKLDTLFI